MTLTKPDFKLDKPNPNTKDIPDAIWWFMLRLEELDKATQNGGILAFKPSFHAPGDWIKKNYPNHYSIRDPQNKTGVGWEKASAWDWTFPDAQKGDYRSIAKYTKRLWASAHDPKDPRLDLWLYEFFGQADSDSAVEGYNEDDERNVSANKTHLWHLHGSVERNKANSFWGAWAVLTAIMGWSVAKWRASLPATDPNSSQNPAPKPPVKPPAKLPHYELGARTLREGSSPGDDIAYVQRFIGPDKMGPADGIAGPKFTSGVKWYQREIMGHRNPDGVLTKGGPTWDRLDGK